MKEIPLTQGVVARVDDCDFEELSKYSWGAVLRSGNWYAQRGYRENGKVICVYMARQILNAPKDMFVDHIKHRPVEDKIADNRRCNIRICTQPQNAKNRKPSKNCTSGVTSVHWIKERKRWLVTIPEPMEIIQLGRVQIEIPARKKAFVGRFKSFEDAVRARREAEKRVYGDFAPRYEQGQTLGSTA